MVPGAGVEPARHCCHWCLRPTRLPIPPSGLIFRSPASIPPRSWLLRNSSQAPSSRSDPRSARRIGWTKIEKIPLLQEFSVIYFYCHNPLPANPIALPLPSRPKIHDILQYPPPFLNPGFSRATNNRRSLQSACQKLQKPILKRIRCQVLPRPTIYCVASGITSPHRNRPAPCVPEPGRSMPTTPRDSPPGPSLPYGNVEEGSPASSAQPLRSAPAHYE